MNEDDAFSPAKLAAMREEIRREGLQPDKFLGSDPDVPTFGLNLACAWPFPGEWRASYELLANRLQELGAEVYVYPPDCTHVTLATFISFARHIRPAPELVQLLRTKLPEIIDALSQLFAEDSPGRICPFVLETPVLVLARGAGFLAMRNPDGEVARLRRRVVELIQANEPLHRELVERGFSVPGILHGTVLRFRRPPDDLAAFLARFDAIAADTKFAPLEVQGVLMTSETKPYMREGEVLWRSRLQSH